MMFEVGVVGQFEAAHRLVGDFGPAARMHGHTYRVEVSVRGEGLGPDGTLCDIGQLRDALGLVVDELAYHDLGELALFEGRNTTAEVVAEVICHRIRRVISETPLQSLAVRVWESPQAYAGVEVDLS